MSDLIKILLSAEVDASSVANIRKQIDGMQRDVKPIEVKAKVSGAQGVTQMTSSLDKLEKVTKKNLSLDLERMAGRFGNLVKPADIANVRSMIAALKFDDPKLGHNIDLIKVKMKEVSVGAENSRRSLDLANKSAMSFGEAMKQAVYKFGIWSAVTATYFKVIREISSGIKYITEMDSALTEIGMVTNQTREQTAGLAMEYNKLAKEMKVLTGEMTSGAVTFYRQGLDQEEVMERLRITTMYSKVANVEFAESAELLTATVNSMNVPIERAADIFTFLGDSTATSAAEVGKGVSKVSGTASELGVELEKVGSWIAHVSSKTRESAESIGNSMKTMLARFSRITETGFNEEDETKINDVAKALDVVNIKLFESDGSFRNFGDIIDDVGGKWDSLDDKTRSYLATTIAGVRQQSRFLNLMNDYGDSVELYEGALESAGTAQSKFNLYLESNQATLDNFRAAIDGLWTSIIDSDSLMNIVRVGTSLIELLDSITSSLGLLGSATAVIIPLIGIRYVAAIVSATKATIAQELAGKGLGHSNISLLSGFKLLIGQLFGAKVAADGATVSFMGLNAAAGILGLAMVGIPVAIMAITSAEDRRKKAMEESIAVFEKQNEVSKNIGTLVKSYEELMKKTELTATESEKLLKVKTEITELLPQSKSAIDNENLSLKEQVEIIKDLNEQEFQRASMVASETIDKYGKDVDFYKNSIEERAKSLDIMGEKLSELQLKQARGQELTKAESDELKNLIQWIELYNEHQENAIDIVESVESAHKLLNKGLEESVERHKWVRAEEIAAYDVKEMSIGQAVRMQEELKSLGFTSDDVANIMSGNLSEVKEKYDVLTEAQIQNMITVTELDEASKISSINMLNRSRDLTVGYIADTKARITAMQAEMRAMSALSGANVSSLMTKKFDNPFDALRNDPAFELVRGVELARANKELSKLEGSLSKIDEALANVSSITPSGMSIGGGASSAGKGKGGKTGSKSSAKTKEEYKAEADAYAKINLELDRNNVLLAKNKAEQDLAGNNLTKKLKLMEEEIALYSERQKLLNQLNTKRRERGRELIEELSGVFKFEGSWDDNSISIVDHSKIAGQSKEIEESYKELLSIIKDLPQASQEWMSMQKDIYKTEFAIIDQTIESKQAMLSLLEKELRYAETDLPDNYERHLVIQGKLLEIEQDKNSTLHKSLIEILTQRDALSENTYEWDMLNDRAEELRIRILDSNTAIMDMQGNILDTNFNHLLSDLDEYQRKLDNLNYELQLSQILASDDANAIDGVYSRITDVTKQQVVAMNDIVNNLRQQQSELSSVSSQWGIIGSQIDDVRAKVRAANLEIARQARDSFSKYTESIKGGAESGKPSSQSGGSGKDDSDRWLDGREKELEVLKLMNYAEEHGIDLSEDQLRILNSRNKIRKSELDIVQKELAFEHVKLEIANNQLDVAEKELRLQELRLKLENLQNEKNIQQLTKKDDGSWDFTYVADIDAITMVEQDIVKAEDEIEKANEKMAETIKKLEGQLIDSELAVINAKKSLEKELRDEANEARQSSYNDAEKHYEDQLGLLDKVLSEAESRMYKTAGEFREALQSLDLDLPIDEMVDEYWGYFLETAEIFVGESVEVAKSQIMLSLKEFKSMGNKVGESYAQGLLDSMDDIMSSDGDILEKQRLIAEMFANEYAQFALAGNKNGMSFAEGLIESMNTPDYEFEFEKLTDYIKGALEKQASELSKSGQVAGAAFAQGLLNSIDGIIEDDQIEDKTQAILDLLNEADKYGSLGQALGEEFIQGFVNTIDNISGEMSGEGEGALSQALESMITVLDGKISEFAEKGDVQGVAYAEALKIRLAEALKDAELTQEDIIEILNEYRDFDIAGLLSGDAYKGSLDVEMVKAEKNTEKSSSAMVKALDDDVENFGLSGESQGEAYKEAISIAFEEATSHAMTIVDGLVDYINSQSFSITVDVDYNYNEPDVSSGIKDLSSGKSKGASSVGGSYAQGGKITETGTFLANFHGKENNPEWIFNDTQLQKVLKSAVLSTISMAAPKIPQLALSGSSGEIKQNVTIREMVFPNVRDAKEIETSVKTLSTYANQWANRN